MIYDDGMRRRFLLVLGALAFAGVAVASGAHAEGEDTTTTSTTPSTAQPTTSSTSSKTRDTVSPPVTYDSSKDPPTTTAPRPSTTVKGGTPTTTVKGSPKPPPASGASQPLDPSLLGGVGPIDLNPSPTTTIGGLFGTEDDLTTTTTFPVSDSNAITVASSSNGPSGAMLGLAAVAWLASLGGVLVYAEDQRAKQWRHLAR